MTNQKYPYYETLIHLFSDYFKEKPNYYKMLPPSGSYRQYFRIKSQNKVAIGTYNADIAENIAFLSFTDKFRQLQLSVPEIYSVSLENDFYLQEDFGDVSLYDCLVATRQDKGFSHKIFELYKKALQQLPKFQVLGAKQIDFTVCYPRPAFDRQSMMWDLNYFKYYFLKLAKITFNEQKLEDDFCNLCNFLLQADDQYFLYRDFQSRNIMVKDDDVYFIDYQGGRKGALQYDVASLLYDSKAEIPQEIRNDLFNHYIEHLSDYLTFHVADFKDYYSGFVLIRIMQAMGAFGFRGFYERKTHFLQSIPYAIDNLKDFLQNNQLSIQIPELWKALQSIVESDELKKFKKNDNNLVVEIKSFSYKKGIPQDESGNGGGFVFDCRSLPNPGREEQYMKYTGKDKPVIDFLSKQPEVDVFLKNTMNLVETTINNYLSRRFNHLQICFGCTGGQHRSVYCAEKFKSIILEKYNIDVVIQHTEQEEDK